MTGLVRAELLKQRSTTTLASLGGAMVAIVGLALALHVLAPGTDQLVSREQQLEVFEAGTRVAMLFAGLAGALVLTAETRFGTIRPTFLMTPQRGRVVAAKLAVSGLAGVAFGLLAQALMAGAATAAYSARGIDVRLSGSDYVQVLAGGTAAAGLWAILGLGVGALVRNQVAAIVGMCAWGLLIENLLLGFVPGVGRLMPGASGLALAGDASTDLLAPVAAVVALTLFATAAAAAGWLATVRRDVA